MDLDGRRHALRCGTLTEGPAQGQLLASLSNASPASLVIHMRRADATAYHDSRVVPSQT
jgi:hypothetical protein